MITYITPYGDTPPPKQNRHHFIITLVGISLLLATGGCWFAIQKLKHQHEPIVKVNTSRAGKLTAPLLEIKKQEKRADLRWPLSKNKGYVGSVIVVNSAKFPANIDDGELIGSSTSGKFVTIKKLSGYICIFNQYDDGRVTLAAQAYTQ